ncbi:hypothetical protein ZWY2020_055002 [Hordeum vulgare]|nr:hypothetical protein ZWY2020_055002 [Hordeum vulgare]
MSTMSEARKDRRRKGNQKGRAVGYGADEELLRWPLQSGRSHALHKRVEQLCTTTIRWEELKRKTKMDKKLAITVFSFPPDKDNVGTTAYQTGGEADGGIVTSILFSPQNGMLAVGSYSHTTAVYAEGSMEPLYVLMASLGVLHSSRPPSPSVRPGHQSSSSREREEGCQIRARSMGKYVELLDMGVRIAARFHSHCPQTAGSTITLPPPRPPPVPATGGGMVPAGGAATGAVAMMKRQQRAAVDATEIILYTVV